MSTYMFLISDPELQAFYTGLMVAAAMLYFVMGLALERRRALSTFVCCALPASFGLTRALTHVSFARLSYAGLAFFLLAVGTHKLLVRRHNKLLEKRHAEFEAEWEARFR